MGGWGRNKKNSKKTNFSVDITSGREGALTVGCYTGVLLARIKLYPQICTPKTLTAWFLLNYNFSAYCIISMFSFFVKFWKHPKINLGSVPAYRLDLTWIHWKFINYSNSICPRKAVCLSLRWLSAHLQKEVKDAFHKKDFFFILIIGGVIRGDVQVNDTFHHRPVKTAYKNLEMLLMLDLLRQDSVKIPSSSRDQMREMFL